MLNSTPVTAQEVKVKVKTPYYSGWVTAVTLETPIYDLVIGNIPGVANGTTKAAVTKTPGAMLEPVDFEEVEPPIGAAVVTRAAAKRII